MITIALRIFFNTLRRRLRLTNRKEAGTVCSPVGAIMIFLFLPFTLPPPPDSSRIHNKYYVRDPCQLCRTTPYVSLFLSFCLDEKSQCANIRSDPEFHDRPLGVVLLPSPPILHTLCAVECSKIRDCVILLMSAVIIAANTPLDDTDR